jgi:hypothetical protein
VFLDFVILSVSDETECEIIYIRAVNNKVNIRDNLINTFFYAMNYITTNFTDSFHTSMFHSIFYSLFGYTWSYTKGLTISGSVFTLSQHMDTTISVNSLENMQNNHPELYADGQDAIITNLIVISPILYTFVDQFILDHSTTFSWIKFSGLLLIQNIGYFFAHREMHRNKSLYWMHHFHHLYEKDLIIPSIANAVSAYEFVIAYASPIVLGGFLLKVNELEFAMAIETISIFNLLIHTRELQNKQWIPGMVSPRKHIEHHRVRNKNYAAPLLDIDAIDNGWVLTETK